LRSARLPLDGSPAADRWRELPKQRVVAGQGNYICGFYGAHLLGEAVATPREQSEKFPIFSMRESRKPRPMVLTYSGLLRSKVLLDIHLSNDYMCVVSPTAHANFG
jgi:hypothetical protein